MTDDERQPVSNDAPDGPSGTETDPWWARPGRQVGLIIAGIAVLIGLGLLRFGGTTMPAVAAEWSDDDVEAVGTE